MKPNAFIFDMDGTLALHEGVRSPYDESKVGMDNPNTNVVNMARTLFKAGFDIIITSGRHESCRADTVAWCVKWGVPVTAMFMRPNASSKREDKDADVKEKIYRNDIETKWNVVGVFDDRQRVVDRWRELGLTCYQVAPGAF